MQGSNRRTLDLGCRKLPSLSGHLCLYNLCGNSQNDGLSSKKLTEPLDSTASSNVDSLVGKR